MAEVQVTKEESPVQALMLVREDGTTEVYNKGFLAIMSEPEEDEELAAVTLYGCNIGGEDMVNTAITVLTPFIMGSDLTEGEE